MLVQQPGSGPFHVQQRCWGHAPAQVPDTGVARAFQKWSDQEVGVVILYCVQLAVKVLIINGCVRLGTDLFKDYSLTEL